MSWSRPQSLRSRLFLLVAAVAAPLMLLAAAVIYGSYLGERQRAEERLQEQAQALALVVDREILRVQAVLETLAASPALEAGNLEMFERQLRAASVPLRGETMALIGSDNQQILSTIWPVGTRHPERRGPEELRQVLQTGRPAVTDLFRGANSGQWVIALGVPALRSGAAGSVSYELVAGIPSGVLGALLAEQHLQPGWIGGVLDRKFMIAARTAEPERFVGTPAVPRLRAALRSMPAGVIRGRRVDGVVASTVFATAPASGLAVVLAVPDELFAAPLRRTLWQTLLLGAAISAGGLSLALTMARRIALSIRSLAEGDTMARPPARLREVEQVAARLARFAAERDAAENALRALAGRLEQQVSERTEALAESEARLRAIFDAQFQYITLLSPDGQRLEMNHSSLEFRGVSREEVMGNKVWDAWWWRALPEEMQRFKEAVARAAAGESVRFECTALGAGGRQSIVDTSVRPVRDRKTGAVRMLIAEGHDITELRALEARVAQTSRLEALGQLAGGVAHDFNNVLQSIAGAMSLIGRRAEDPAAVRRMSGLVNEAIDRGASVTRRLLGFARRDALRAAPLDVATLLDNLREVLSHTLGEAICVTVQVAPGLPPLLADHGQLETVLVNLATNARDAMAQGGELRFSASAVQIAEVAGSAPGLQPGRYILLSAADKGCGMDAPTLARAMEPFFTTKQAGQGTGLGLSMARGFAEQSGGALEIESTPGAGTIVRLWLPEAVAAPPRPAAALLPGVCLQRVLLVEDNPLVRELLAAALELYGYNVMQAGRSSEALALLETVAGVDLLISDLSMPGMNGLDLIRTVRQNLPGLPAILLTGYAGDAAALARDAGLQGTSFVLLQKPVTERQLVDQCAMLLDVAMQSAS